ncbi:ATP-NAD kinase-like domain-containing protein [Cladochytrium replicatum]|nr:ATP-NAD kinase-like domain-containing protein [Cladochytrium replicatum]
MLDVFWIVVNPVSGKKLAEEILESAVKPSLLESGFAEVNSPLGVLSATSSRQFFPIHTTYRGHAAEFVRQHIREWDDKVQVCLTIICMGGDGTIHEVVNALYYSTVQVPPNISLQLGVVPCGSGNALATSLGVFSAEEGIRRILSGTSRPLNVASVHVTDAPQEDEAGCVPVLSPEEANRTLVAHTFCVVSWGLHAQIVKISELFRFMGPRRFFYVAVTLNQLCRQYPGSLYLFGGKEGLKIEGQTEVRSRNWVQLQSGNSGSAANLSNTSRPIGSEVDETTPLKSTHALRATLSFTYFISTWMSALEPGFRIAPYADAYSSSNPPASAPIDLVMGVSLNRVGLNRMIVSALKDGSHADLDKVETLDRGEGAGLRFVKCDGYCLVPTTWLDRSGGWFARILRHLRPSRPVHDFCLDGEMITIKQGQGIYVLKSKQLLNVLS